MEFLTFVFSILGFFGGILLGFWFEERRYKKRLNPFMREYYESLK